jgi:hypothetical protein
VQDLQETDKSCTMLPPKKMESATTPERKKGSATIKLTEKSKQESSPSPEKKKKKMGEDELT